MFDDIKDFELFMLDIWIFLCTLGSLGGFGDNLGSSCFRIVGLVIIQYLYNIWLKYL